MITTLFYNILQNLFAYIGRNTFAQKRFNARLYLVLSVSANYLSKDKILGSTYAPLTAAHT